MRIGIIQSSYIPWKGYFDFIDSVDVFVFLEDVQFTRRDWRNRNIIKTANGPRWLTLPVESKGKYDQLISDVRVADRSWYLDHLNSLRHAYARAPHFKVVWPYVESMYSEAASEEHLSSVNVALIRSIMGYLNIRTPLRLSTEFPATSGKNERLMSICSELGATEYVSGPAARSYIDEKTWADAGIRVRYKSYSGYGEYPQLHGEFEDRVSILDLLFNCGPDSARFLQSAPRFDDEQ